MRATCAAVLLSACATPALKRLDPLPELDPSWLAEPEEGWPDEPAVILHREERYTFGLVGGTWLYRHDVIKILRESGLSFAQMQIAHSEGGRLAAIGGRSIRPDGRERHIELERMIHDATDVGPDHRANVFIVLFPEVEVGSVLQLHYQIRESGLPAWYERPISESIPIRSYRATVTHEASFRVDARAYNTSSTFSRIDDRTLVLSIAGIPKRSDDPLIAGPELIEPYWVYVLRHASGMGPVLAEWSDAVEAETRLLHAGRASFVRGWKKPSLLPCTGERCVEAAIGKLRELRFNGFGAWPGRSAQEIASSDQATGLEKARLLYELLADVPGLETSFALTTRRFSARVDESFPRPASFDHVIVRVKVGGEEIWIDPSCDHCELDQIPPWLAKGRALVVGYQPAGLVRNDAVTAEWRDIEGEVVTTDLARTHFELSIEESGDVSGSAEIELAGVAALFRRQSTADWSDERWKQSAHEALTARVSTAKLESHRPMSFSAGRGVGGYTFRVSGYGTIDEDRLLVPLTVLRAGFADMLGSKERRAPVTFATAAHDMETMSLALPAGWIVERLPEPFTIDHPYFRVSFEAEEDGTKVVVRREIEAHVGQHGLDRLEDARGVLERYDGLRQATLVLRKR